MSNFSIVTVVYNASGTIARTIESTLNQSFPVYEYIIIDGNSNDDSLQIINRYKDLFTDKNIRFIVVSENDNGIYDAMNKGILLSTGDWIGILNADDYYDSNTLSYVQNHIISDNCDLVYGNMNIIENGNIKELTPKNDLNILYSSMSLFHPSIFIKKSIYDRYGLYSLEFKLSSDWDLVLRLFHNNVKFSFLNKTLSNFTSGGAGSGFRLIHYKERLKIRHKFFRLTSLYYDFKDFIILIFHK